MQIDLKASDFEAMSFRIAVDLKGRTEKTSVWDEFEHHRASLRHDSARPCTLGCKTAHVCLSGIP